MLQSSPATADATPDLGTELYRDLQLALRETVGSRTLDALLDAAKDADREEHWRLAYVALTRAAERLVIAGVKPKRDVPQASWHATAASHQRQGARSFLTWAMTGRHIPVLQLPALRFNKGEAITQHRRLTLLRRYLTEENAPELRELVARLFSRRTATGDKRDPLYRMQPERWLESVRRHVRGQDRGTDERNCADEGADPDRPVAEETVTVF